MNTAKHFAQGKTPLEAEGTIVLLEKVLRGTPALPDALCRNRPADVFDGDDEDKTAEAIRLCRRCPDRTPCARWAASVPDKELSGVVAGEHREWFAHESLRKPRGRPRKVEAS